MKQFALAGLLVTTVALFGEIAPAQADPITYTFELTGSGVLDAVAFTNQLVTFTLFGNTDAVITGISDEGDTCAVCQANSVTGTVRVGALTDTIAEHMDILMVPLSLADPDLLNLPAVILFEGDYGFGMAGTLSNALNGKNLTTAVGPISGIGGATPKGPGEQMGAELTTARGTFYWTTEPVTSTYTSTVPEPGSLMLLGTGLMALAGGHRFRRRRLNRG